MVQNYIRCQLERAEASPATIRSISGNDGMEQVLSSASGNCGSIYHPMWCIKAIRKKSLISYHFPKLGKMVTFSPHISRPTLAHQMLCIRTSSDVQAHNSWCAALDTISSNNFSYIFQQLPLYTSTFSPIFFCIRKRFTGFSNINFPSSMIFS